MPLRYSPSAGDCGACVSDNHDAAAPHRRRYGSRDQRSKGSDFRCHGAQRVARKLCQHGQPCVASRSEFTRVASRGRICLACPHGPSAAFVGPESRGGARCRTHAANLTRASIQFACGVKRFQGCTKVLALGSLDAHRQHGLTARCAARSQSHCRTDVHKYAR